MHFAPGSGVIRVGDPTSHGGSVLTGQENCYSYGRPVAVVGDKVACPVHGLQTIVTGEPTYCINGQPVAVDGSQTSCGAKLFSSLSGVHCLGNEAQASAYTSPPSNTTELHSPRQTSAREASSPPVFDEKLVITHQGRPVVDYPYYARTQDGRIYHGRTNRLGESARITTQDAETLEIYLGDEALARTDFLS
ncbi:MAG: PAAR domain-containing protein [Gammaproteobacteria bacterium]|nr:PAAR domain-containing protein [Gammaproteobacteria bacterium]